MVDGLDVAALFFGLQGGLYVLIGALTPFMIKTVDGGGTLFFTPRADAGYFGGDTHRLILQDPNLLRLRNILLIAIAGLLASLGITVVALAWYGVARGEAWAVLALAAAGGVALVYWVYTLHTYASGGSSFGLGDVPPFMWLTSVLWAAGCATSVVAWWFTA